MTPEIVVVRPWSQALLRALLRMIMGYCAIAGGVACADAGALVKTLQVGVTIPVRAEAVLVTSSRDGGGAVDEVVLCVVGNQTSLFSIHTAPTAHGATDGSEVWRTANTEPVFEATSSCGLRSETAIWSRTVGGEGVVTLVVAAE